MEEQKENELCVSDVPNVILALSLTLSKSILPLDVGFSILKMGQSPPSCRSPGAEVTGVRVLVNRLSQGRRTGRWLFSLGEEGGAGNRSRVRSGGAVGVEPLDEGSVEDSGRGKRFF